MRPSPRALAGALLAPLLLGSLCAGRAEAGETDPFVARVTSAVHGQLRAWAEAHDAAELQRYGESAGGRPLLALQVAGPGALPPSQRPAVFVAGNAAGDRPLGSEAALDLLEELLREEGPEPRRAALLGQVTFYVVPVVNPDAHDALLRAPRWDRRGNAAELDQDRDGLVAEDGPDDLDGDGRLAWLRLEDPSGEWLPDPRDPRLLVRAAAELGEQGRYRLEREGRDDDGDGRFNEDPPGGIHVDRGFPHGFPYPSPEAGPWASAAPEVKALLDYLLARRNVALAVVFGERNSLLKLPSAGKRPPDQAAAQWTKGDRASLDALARRYRALLEAREQSAERSGSGDFAGGSLAAWLYFQFGALTLELDVWQPPLDALKPTGKPLALGELAKLDAAGLLARPADDLEGLLDALGAPGEVGELRASLEAGRLTPATLAKELRPYEAFAKTPAGKARAQARLEHAYWTAHQPAAITTWTRVELPGEQAEVGGLAPWAAQLPPRDEAGEALAAHTSFLLEAAQQLPRLELRQVRLTPLHAGPEGVYRLEVVAGNGGRLPTHTELAQLGRVRRPVRLELELGQGVALVTGKRWKAKESLGAGQETLRGTWLLRGPPGARVTVRVTSEQAGGASKALRLEQE